MEFIKGYIYGFGKFQKVSLEFDRGFHVVFVKDLSGKNTLLQFLLDMLFSQRTSGGKNTSFNENYYKYIPWHTQDYRGNMVYRLNTGKLIHLHRVFGPETSLRIYEGMDVRDITDTLPVYPNGEPAFTQNYLQLNQEIFTGVATISQKTIENSELFANVEKIAEHLRCLIDTGTTEWSVQDIITVFQEYLLAIGTERSYRRPRNFISEQLERLVEEYEQAKAYLETIRQKKLSLKRYKEQWNITQREYDELQEKLQYSRQYALWRKKNDIKALREKLDELTARSFSYSNYRNFPIEKNTYVLQMEMAILHAESQKQKLQNEIENITKEINKRESELRRLTFTPIDNIRDYQDKFEEYLKHIYTNEELLKELYNQREKVAVQIQEVEKIVLELPEVMQKDDMYYQKVDFTVDLYKSSLKELQKSESRLNEIKEELACVEEKIKPFLELFYDMTDFTALVEDYLRYKDKPEEEQRELEKKLQETDELKYLTHSRQPIELVIGVLCFLLGLLLIYIYLKTHQRESLWFAGAVSLAFFYFLSSYLDSRHTLKEIHIVQQQIKEKIQKITSFEYIDKHPITNLLHKANLQHVRELQGLYDEYCNLLKQREDVIQQVQKAEELFGINQSRTNDLFREMQKLFEQVCLPLENGEKIENNRRKVFELQEKTRMYNRRLWDLREQYQQLSDSITRKEEYIKKIHLQIKDNILNKIEKELLQSGVLQPGEELSRDTFYSYYKAEEDYCHLEKNVFELRKKRLDLNQQLQKIEEENSQNQEQIREILESAGVRNLSEWKSKYSRAEEAHLLFSRIEQTKLQIEQLLDKDTLEELEQCLQDFVPSSPVMNENELQPLIDQKQEEIQRLQQKIQSIEKELKDFMEKFRPLNEIYEEKKYYESQWKVLQYEQESVLLSISALQQLSTYRYHKIALPLQNEISRLLNKLTKGKYTVIVEQDLTLRILPAGSEVAYPMEEYLSTPTILEQVYFAMRIALMKIPNYLKESLPLLLDDLFGKGDYPQLFQSLNTLKVLGEEQQIILFTCRDEIPDIAKNLDIPVMTIEDMG